MTVSIEIGPGRAAMPTVFPDTAGDLAGQLTGFRVTHPRGGIEGAPECHGGNGSWIPTHDEDHGWTVVSLDPLTLTPSLACRVCGDHGFIREGTWVPA